MEKFEIVEITDEWECRSWAEAESYRPGETLDGDGRREYLEVFDTLEEAKENLKFYKNSYELMKNFYNNSYFLVKEYFVTQSEYDEDGDLIQEEEGLEMADASEWDIALNRRLGNNKFRLDVATWDGAGYVGRDTIVPESEEWFHSVEDFLRALDVNHFFDDAYEAPDEETKNEYYTIVATYPCDDGDEDRPISWAELKEILKD